jgi:hypothetical protein
LQLRQVVIWRMLFCMRRKRKDVREQDVTGLKYFRRLVPLFERLREVGCQRDKAGNRTLFMDQYCLLVLLYLFNPVVVSLRSLQQASELKKVQKKLGCARASLGSLSESSHVFDPQLLQEIIGELGEQLTPIAADRAAGGDSAHGDARGRHAAQGLAPDRGSHVADDPHGHGASRLATPYPVRAR